MNDEPSSEGDSSFRDLFPVTRNVVYFNHAAVGPLSVRACEAMERHARDQREFGALHWREWYAEYDRLRIVTVSSVAFHNGFAADLDAIGALCAQRNVLFCVDAIQSVGVLPIDVRRAKIAFLAADGHKWMCGAEGAALFYVAAAHRDELEVIENGWTNIDRRGKFILSPTDLLSDARRFEAGSLNTNGIYGLRAAIELLLEIGIEAVAQRALAVANRLADGLESIGWRVATRPVA